jgi:hypothetical protein
MRSTGEGLVDCRLVLLNIVYFEILISQNLSCPFQIGFPAAKFANAEKRAIFSDHFLFCFVVVVVVVAKVRNKNTIICFFFLAQRCVRFCGECYVAGTTWHSAGMLWRLRPSDIDIELHAYGRELCLQLEREIDVSQCQR